MLQLSQLPEQLHVAALHAAHPTLASTFSLPFSKEYLTRPTVEHLWRAVAKATFLKSLQVGSVISKCNPHCILVCISSLTSLRSLELSLACTNGGDTAPDQEVEEHCNTPRERILSPVHWLDATICCATASYIKHRCFTVINQSNEAW